MIPLFPAPEPTDPPVHRQLFPITASTVPTDKLTIEHPDCQGSVGQARQRLNLLTYALAVNALALHRHRRTSSDPPLPIAA